MEIATDFNPARYQIKSYQPGAVTINEQTYTQSIVLSAHELITDWAPQSLSALNNTHWASVLACYSKPTAAQETHDKPPRHDPFAQIPTQPGILLLGVGEEHQFPHAEQLSALHEQRVGVEIMTNDAACRTFNILVSDERPVVIALLLG